MVHYVPGINGIKSGKDGTWNTTVKNFDTNRFVADVQQTGAAYVVFSVGQNSDYYVAPSAAYTKKTGTLPGQYVSERDLIADLSVALKAAGIKLLVYATAQGPLSAPSEIMTRFPVPNDQATPAERATLNAMYEEWSKRWGTNVAGWWLDGCYPWVGGYYNPTDGEQNIDALLRAVRTGNPGALATCNPSAELFKSVSQEQDYMAGEENEFERFPGAQPEQFKGKGLIWHMTSYLGRQWGDGELTRSPDQLASYIRLVSDRAGVVTVDLGIRADGSLFPAQLQAMSRVRSLIRDAQTAPANPNLALYKNAFLTSNVTGLDLPVSGGSRADGGKRYQHSALFAIDGQRDYYDAQAAQEWPWSLVVDLGSTATFSKAIVTFQKNLYATDANLEISDDRQRWQSVKHLKPTVGGTYTLDFPRVAARYVRLQANKPDGPNQPGGQMAVAELELYAD